MSSTLALVLHAAFGLAILLFGRRLFWLFVAVAGFAAGGFACVPLAAAPGGNAWIPVGGGMRGAFVMILIFDWALIFLSALVGTQIVAEVLDIRGMSAVIPCVLLIAVAATFQASFLEAAKVADRG